MKGVRKQININIIMAINTCYQFITVFLNIFRQYVSTFDITTDATDIFWRSLLMLHRTSLIREMCLVGSSDSNHHQIRSELHLSEEL